MRIVVAGVAGSGKSTVGTVLAERLDACFVDGDTLHPVANTAKMSAGQPLDDNDRWPWLDAIVEVASEKQTSWWPVQPWRCAIAIGSDVFLAFVSCFSSSTRHVPPSGSPAVPITS